MVREGLPPGVPDLPKLPTMIAVDRGLLRELLALLSACEHVQSQGLREWHRLPVDIRLAVSNAQQLIGSAPILLERHDG